jgi:hypothetical protein
LAQLVDSAGADVVARVVQRRDAPDAATFVGRGKAEEIAALSRSVDADTVVFDDELSPAQHRNLEKIFGRTAIDRTAVILDIFAQNARSPEGKAQVELALLRYRLPGDRARPSSKWTGGGWCAACTAWRPTCARWIAPVRCSVAAAPGAGTANWRWWVTPTRVSRRCSTPSPMPACRPRTGCS